MSHVFSRVRKDLVVALMATGAAVALSGCKSNEANYRPQPTTTSPSYTGPTYTPPPSYTPPAATAPQPAKPPQMACGKGKCG